MLFASSRRRVCMSYLGSTEQDAHRQAPLTAVVLVNLGTPDAPTPRALRRYLAEFLADPRVVEIPRWRWRLILHGAILRIRPARSARAYRRVWTAAGSPLLTLSRELTTAVAAELRRRLGAAAPEVALAMNYGNPNLRDVLEDLRRRGLRRLLLLPLYPQYSATTTAAVFDAATRELRRWRWLPELRFVADYHRAPGYVEALAASVRAHWLAQGRGERLLLSFHGIPRHHLDAGDPYYCQCQVSARQLRAALELDESALQLAFQSRVGRAPWLRPYTEQTLLAWARAGIRRVDVLCPGFAVDCLETLEEIAGQNAEAFVRAGGERLSYIPALNASSAHAQLLAGIVQRQLAGWTAASDDRQMHAERIEAARRQLDGMDE
ncbi:MAG: ferrochelatase [Xanthomonadales bacterium PRO6]|nr:ferrochelatase [Xanthomonadales bacterium PRO6]